ncbi:hypothetical protein AB0C90_07885 [Streptomyces sp. NPDC048550]|uniref:hypothetical protein n=1 Tax=unclassified Streptomyces TaxID=2593676 RepID=UPI0022518FB5|nr:MULTISPECIES: hypothetical protein [unclassified Streptomyces]MCX5147994.1 hypothetical protein [Streptomyces sp. NBC_00320]WSN51082.1 hypothetical protein OG299_27100 [Streptomyces sp. NBC_01296]WSW59467.1 hypothetical protein OG513_13215 [Streptomyces sp. NBC_00998]
MNDGPLLHPAEMDRIREGIAAAVLGAPDGLADSLEHDAHGYLRLVDASRVGAEEASRLLREAVQGARAAGHSWDTVGRVLGVSRQAAQQRFSDKTAGSSSPPAEGPNAPKRRTLSGLTAFNEMAALDEAGRDGWHMVGYGPFFHEVEASTHPWEHCRVTLPSLARHRRMESEGWIPVGAGWFPWRYYKRPLRPAD